MSIFSSGRSRPNQAFSRLATSPYRLILCLFLVLAAPLAFAGATYFTGTDNENNAGTGVADDDMDVSIGTLDPNEPVEFNIDVTGEKPSNSAYLYIRAFDVDSTANVYHYVFLNGVKLGRLAGSADTWSTTEFKVPLSAVHQGKNTVLIWVDGWNQGFRTEIDWGRLVLDEDAAHAADITDISINDYSIADGNVTIDAQSTVKVEEAGDYVVEFNLIYPDSARSEVVKQHFTAAAGEEVVRQYTPGYPLNSASGTYIIEALLFQEKDGELIQQDSDSLSFKHQRGVGPDITSPTITWAISSNQETVIADGESSATITVQAQDAAGQDLSTSGASVQLATTLGTLSQVTDNHDGSYTATLTSSATGTATVSANVNSLVLSHTVQVQFVAGAASAEQSSITASPSAIQADGESTSTITVQLLDANGNKLTAGGDQVQLSTTLGSLSAVTDNLDGTYTATLTSTTAAGIATVSGSLNEAAITDVAEVSFETEGPSTDVSDKLTASPAALVADGVAKSIITVQLLDSEGQPLHSGGYLVALSTDRGKLSAVKDNQDGTYTASFTAPAKIGALSAVATINSSIDGVAGTTVKITLSLNPNGDEDGDGIKNGDEGTGDKDGDGVPNYLDIDSDDDGLLDSVEGKGDPDGDGIPNYLDTDSDGDSLTDLEENSGLTLTGSDHDHDGLDDVFDVDATGGTDTVNRGVDDQVDPVSNADGDSAPNFLDTDSDDDGILDANEPEDYNGDGTPDYLQKPVNLKTAVRGGGSFGAGLLLPLIGLLAVRKRAVGVAALSVIGLLSSAAQAGDCPKDEAFHSYDSDCWYAGAGLGLTRLVPKDDHSDWGVSDKTDQGYKVFLGYQLTSRWKVELSYSDLGEAGVTPKNPFLGDERGIRYTVPAVWGIYQWPINQSAWSLFAKAGIGSIQNSADSIVAYEKVTGAQLALGAGVQRKLNEKWFVRAEVDSFDKDAAYLGVSIARFWGNSDKPAKPAPVPVVEEVKDSDGDGVKDPQDKCPNTPPGRKVNADGCEEPAPPVETIRLNVQFKTGSSDIAEKYQPEIEKVAIFMRNHPDCDAVIEGHTDDVGKDSFNQKLSENRAAAVREVLIKRFNIAADRVTSVGYGESAPVASNLTEAGRAQNRRVVAVLPR